MLWLRLRLRRVLLLVDKVFLYSGYLKQGETPAFFLWFFLGGGPLPICCASKHPGKSKVSVVVGNDIVSWSEAKQYEQTFKDQNE